MAQQNMLPRHQEHPEDLTLANLLGSQNHSRGNYLGLLLAATLVTSPLAAQQQAFSMLDGQLVRFDLENATAEALASADEDRISDLTDGPAGLLGLRFPVLGGEPDGLVELNPASGDIENLGTTGTVGATAIAQADGMLWLGLGNTVVNVIGDTGIPTVTFPLPWTADALAGRGSTLYAFGQNGLVQVELAIIDLDSGATQVMSLAGVLADLIDDAAVDGNGSLWLRTLVSAQVAGFAGVRHYRLVDPASGNAELVSEAITEVGDPLASLTGLAFGPPPALDIPTLGHLPLLLLMLVLAITAGRTLRRLEAAEGR